MPKKQFALEPGGPKRVTLSWSGFWKNFEIAFDGTLVGRIETKQQLETGSSFALPDGSQLNVQLKRVAMTQELQVLRNGIPLPGSASEPAERLSAAAGMLYFVAVLNAALGILAGLAQVTFLLSLGLGYASVIVGGIYGGLGYLVKAKRSRPALVVAIVLFALDGLASVFLAVQHGGSPPVGGLVARVFFLMPMWKGLGALTELKSAPTTS
jgi:hypothetical protein